MNMNATKVSATQTVSGSATTRSMLENTSIASRLLYSAASVALIGTAYVISAAPLGVFLVLPLIGIYTGLGVILGRSPLATIIDANKAIPYIVPTVAEAMVAQRTRMTAARAA